MRRNHKLLNVLLLIAVGVFLFVAGRLLTLYLEYQRGSQSYDDLKEFVQETDKGSEKPDKEEAAEQGRSYLQVDFEGLIAKNPDVVAWLQIPALDISYPVVQGKDNDYYLHHMFNREAHKNGCIFVDCHNQPDFSDSNTIIYGHNMRDGSMFGTLERYQNQELYEQYPYFYIYVPGYVLEYQIISCYAGKTSSIGYTYHFSGTKDFQDFIDKIYSYAGYDTGTQADEEDKIVTLSTCVNSKRDYRFLIHGKLVKKIRNGE